MRFDASARGYDARIKEVRASYADELRNILVIGSDGTFAEDSTAPCADERLVHCENRQEFGARKLRWRRTRCARLLLWRENS